MMDTQGQIERAAELILSSEYSIAFTGAGISRESGVPTFRGADSSIWSRYDPDDLEISHFLADPAKSWRTIKACFYDFMKDRDIRPNKAHHVLAAMEGAGLLRAVVTQNIDNLHQRAGSKAVIEFHGTAATVSCTACHRSYSADEADLSAAVPRCGECGGLLKPDFVFFGEGIPPAAYMDSFVHANAAKLCIVVGTSAKVMPAGMIPTIVKQTGGSVIEVNPVASDLTGGYTDVHIPLGAVEAFTRLEAALREAGAAI